jgi:putative Mg2+ transporter-C (MgtC) family protein
MDPELFRSPDASVLIPLVLRLGSAAILGGLIGLERGWAGKPAGVRTHMMVALGAALFVVAPAATGPEAGEVSRVIQGIAAGIGFLGGGTIVKGGSESQIEGLTSAATIWFTAAIGIAVAVGQLWLAIGGVVCAWLVLSVAQLLERWAGQRRSR